MNHFSIVECGYTRTAHRTSARAVDRTAVSPPCMRPGGGARPWQATRSTGQDTFNECPGGACTLTPSEATPSWRQTLARAGSGLPVKLTVRAAALPRTGSLTGSPLGFGLLSPTLSRRHWHSYGASLPPPLGPNTLLPPLPTPARASTSAVGTYTAYYTPSGYPAACAIVQLVHKRRVHVCDTQQTRRGALLLCNNAPAQCCPGSSRWLGWGRRVEHDARRSTC